MAKGACFGIRYLSLFASISKGRNVWFNESDEEIFGICLCYLAEGYRKKTLDYARFVQMSQASLQETTYHLLLSRDLVYLDEEDYSNLHGRAETVGKMLSGLHKSILRAK